MEFDKSRVYTALNADELKVGSKVIVSDTLYHLKRFVKENVNGCILTYVNDEHLTNRFVIGSVYYALAYLVSEPEEKKLKWTDLKHGDVIRNGEFYEMITGIHKNEDTDKHVFVQGKWISDEQLKNWEKVEK